MIDKKKNKLKFRLYTDVELKNGQLKVTVKDLDSFSGLWTDDYTLFRGKKEELQSFKKLGRQEYLKSHNIRESNEIKNADVSLKIKNEWKNEFDEISEKIDTVKIDDPRIANLLKNPVPGAI